MANIKGYTVSRDSLTIFRLDGGTTVLTKAQVQAAYAATTGNSTARKSATIAWVQDYLAQDGLTASDIGVDVDVNTGDILSFGAIGNTVFR